MRKQKRTIGFAGVRMNLNDTNFYLYNGNFMVIDWASFAIDKTVD